MDSTARARTAPKPQPLAEAIRPLCETSLPGMARYVRTRLRYHGYPTRPETLVQVLQDSYEEAVVEAAAQPKLPRPAGFRKYLTAGARTALYKAIEADQRHHLAAVVEAFEGGHADPWPGPVPSRQIARLTRSALEGIDRVPGVAERIVLRAVASGTHTPAQLSRLLDLPDIAPTLARGLGSLLDGLAGKDQPGLPGFVQSLKDQPAAPPAALLAGDARGADAERQRASEMAMLAGMTAEQIAARVGRKADAVGKMLEESGLGEGPWHRAGAMLVDLVQFTRELEIRDLAAYVDRLCAGQPDGNTSWKLINRNAKVLAFWLRSLVSRVNGSTYGHGLTGPWVRARLAGGKHSVSDLRKWLSEGGLKAADLGRGGAKLPAKLAALCAARTPPPGPDLSRPWSSLPASKAADKHEKQLAKAIVPQLEKLVRGR